MVPASPCRTKTSSTQDPLQVHPCLSHGVRFRLSLSPSKTVLLSHPPVSPSLLTLPRASILAAFLVAFLVIVLLYPQSSPPTGSRPAMAPGGMPYSEEPSSELRVLFLGNSYTYFNELPSIIQNMSTTAGDVPPLHTHMFAKGGWRLQQHAEADDVTNLLIQGPKWRYVVLQEQSQLLSFSQEDREELSISFVGQLADKIRASGAEPLLFLTWGRKQGDRKNLPNDTFHAMQSRLVEGYSEASTNFSTRIVPVGLAWEEYIRRHPDANLWVADESHPNLKGSYLAACVFYGFLYSKTPLGNLYTAGLDQAEAKGLQEAAAEVLKRS